MQRLKSHGTDPVTGTIQDAAARIARQLGLKRRVRLLQSALVDTPLVIGALKPVILLPAALITELPADQLEALLAHELAHVLRQDYLINLLQSVVETLLFYHPAVWWISSQVRKERENCCDDLAVNVACDRTVYVRALATVAGARASSMAPAATGGLLVARLRRILGIADRQGAQSSRWLTGAAILSLCVFAIASTSLGSRSATAQSTAASRVRRRRRPPRRRLDRREGGFRSRLAASHKRLVGGPISRQFPTKGSMRSRSSIRPASRWKTRPSTPVSGPTKTSRRIAITRPMIRDSPPCCSPRRCRSCDCGVPKRILRRVRRFRDQRGRSRSRHS